MLLPVIIHIVGFAAVDAMIGGDIVAADADMLAIWYAWFVFIDFVALRSFTTKTNASLIAKTAVIVSMCWSLILVGEMLLLKDMFQQADQTIQLYIDVAIGISLLWYAFEDTKKAVALHKDAN